MILPGACYQEPGWERVKDLLVRACVHVVALPDATIVDPAIEPEVACTEFIERGCHALHLCAAGGRGNHPGNVLGDTVLSLAYALLVECQVFAPIFVAHRNKLIQAAQCRATGQRSVQPSTVLGNLFADLRDAVDARGIQAATGQPWSPNRLWIYRKVDESWRELARMFANTSSSTTREQVAWILNRTLTEGCTPIEARRLRTPRDCHPQWLIRWSELTNGWLHNTKRADGWKARPEKLLEVLHALADGADMANAGNKGATAAAIQDGGWLDDYAKVMDASIAAEPDGTDDDELALPEPGRPLTYGGVTVDPFDEPEDDLLPSDDVDDPDGLCNETEGDSSQQDPDIDDALRRAFSRSIKAASEGEDSLALELRLGLPPGYVKQAMAADDPSSVALLFGPSISLWVRMELFKQFLGPSDDSFAPVWCLPETCSLPTQRQLSGLEGVSPPTFRNRVGQARDLLLASNLGTGRMHRQLRPEE
jgi:hypothetical protein